MTHTAYGKFGTHWRSRTSIVCWNAQCDLLQPLSAQCHGPTCVFSGKRHQTLEGRAPGGKLWTQVAEPCPHRLQSF
eukprot:8434570-Pyramimonas_sp.AAC.1